MWGWVDAVGVCGWMLLVWVWVVAIGVCGCGWMLLVCVGVGGCCWCVWVLLVVTTLIVSLQGMSLLLSEEEEEEEEEGGVPEMSSGADLFFEGPTSRGKASKRGDRKGRAAEDKKGSSKSKARHSDNVVQESRAARKVKGQSKTTSKTPPDSPKVLRGVELRAGGRGLTGPQLQPSPNVKNQRKRYSQLWAGSSEEEGEGQKENEGFLLSNQPALREEVGGVASCAVLPFDDQAFPNPAPLIPTGIPVSKELETEQAWVPTAMTSGQTTGSMLFPETSPFIAPPSAKPSFPPSLGGGTTNPLILGGELGRGEDSLFLPSHPADWTANNPFLSSDNQFTSIQTSFSTPAPLSSPPSPPPSQQVDPPLTTHPTSVAPPPDDWSLSDDLRSKCIQRFNELQPIQGLLHGDQARTFFIQSKLPNHELSTIW